MTALAEKIYNEALDLPTEERLTLLDRLLHIGSIGTYPEIDQAWCKEAEYMDAVNFYENRQPGLGRKLFSEI